MVQIEELGEFRGDDLAQLTALTRDLHEDTRTPAREEVERIVNDPNIILTVVRDGERIIGMATLYIIQKLALRSSLLEEVIVDASYRGQGLGRRLIEEVIALGKERGVQSISLTSRSERAVANKLYQSLGFQKKETNVYRLSI